MTLNGAGCNTEEDKLTARGRKSPTETKRCGKQLRTNTWCTESALMFWPGVLNFMRSMLIRKASPSY